MDHIIKSGFLDVGDGYSLYYEEWGNPKAQPFFYLHGGPGDGFSDSNKFLFDPVRHHVIFHDQRGCGRSTPSASTKHNTTQDLINDITQLVNHLKIKQFTLVGGSWGSTLSLLYAINHPEKVKQLLIWSVYLVRQFETDYVNEGYGKYTFPEAWERFIALVPKEHRKNGDEIMQYYAEKIRSKDASEAKKYADEWTIWEYTLITRPYDKNRVEKEILEAYNIAMARIETHYFTNKCFISENYILENIDKIKHISCYVVQGRFDMCTPPIAARDLAEAYGDNLVLQWTNGGHLRSEPENFAAIKAIANVIV